MELEWAVISDFPNYLVSSNGDIVNVTSGGGCRKALHKKEYPKLDWFMEPSNTLALLQRWLRNHLYSEQTISATQSYIWTVTLATTKLTIWSGVPAGSHVNTPISSELRLTTHASGRLGVWIQALDMWIYTRPQSPTDS